MAAIKASTIKKIQTCKPIDIMKFGGQASGEGRFGAFREDPSAETAGAIVNHFANNYANLLGIDVAEIFEAAASVKPKKAKAAKAEAKPVKKATKEVAKPAKKAAKPVKEEPKKKKKK